MSKIQCTDCGAVFEDAANYCPNCGRKLKNIDPVPNRKETVKLRQPQNDILERKTVLLKPSHEEKTAAASLEYNGRNYKIDAKTWTIGADHNSDFILDFDVITNHHAEIICHQERYYIKDIHSTNGTYINGFEILTERETELKDNDRLTFANIDTVFHLKINRED